MTIPAPRPGLVIRYAFLWSHERDAGAIEGSKDRPCAIVVALPRDANGHIGTIAAPIPIGRPMTSTPRWKYPLPSAEASAWMTGDIGFASMN